jgi:hypothetical protein
MIGGGSDPAGWPAEPDETERGDEMTAPADGRSPIEVLSVEDDPGDVLMTQEAFEEHKLRNRRDVCSDGAAALATSAAGG